MSNFLKKLRYHFWPLWMIPLKFTFLWSDRSHLEYMYRKKMKKKIVLSRDNKNLLLYNEKIQWLKLYDRQPEYTDMSDKYNVRKYVSQTIGEEYLVPCYGVWDRFEDIAFDALPNQFVLKCTHDCGSILICNDKMNFNLKKAEKHFRKRLSRNAFWRSRQWAYKDIKPRIIAEKFLLDESGVELKDYKIFCFGGDPKIIQVDSDRYTSHKRDFYSVEWKLLPITTGFPSIPGGIEKPSCLELMLELAKKLSAGKIHVRVDLYVINGNIYFGELTFYHGSGFRKFDQPEWDRAFGDWMTLPI